MTASLIERVESAAEGSQDLDIEIMTLIGGARHVDVGVYYGPNEAVWHTSEAAESDGSYHMLPSPSRYFSAGLALADRLGWRLFYLDASIIGRTSVMLQSVDDRPGTDPETGARLIGKDFASNSGKTHALALCASILRAHEASQ